jgi:di/tricarboxylate transporter
VQALAQAGLKINGKLTEEHISKHGGTMIEIVLAPHSQAIGHSVRELEFHARYGFLALVLFHSGRRYRTDVRDFPLQLGDSLLMIGSKAQINRLRHNPDFIVLEPDPSDQPIDRFRSGLTIGVLTIAILTSILGAPVYLTMLTGAVILLLTGALNMKDAYRAIEWQAIVAIAGLYTVSLAMVNTGLADLIGELLISIVQPLGPLGLVAGAYIMTAILVQVMGGQITALVAGPITISAAISMNINPQAVAVATGIACSTAFFTPLAHPVNILMISPANYQFKDFFHIGWRLSLVCFVMLLVGMILFWGM